MTDQPTDASHDTPYEAQIRERARFLWMNAGSPSGRDEEFWHKAEAELKQEAMSQAAVIPPPQPKT